MSLFSTRLTLRVRGTGSRVFLLGFVSLSFSLATVLLTCFARTSPPGGCGVGCILLSPADWHMPVKWCIYCRSRCERLKQCLMFQSVQTPTSNRHSVMGYYNTSTYTHMWVKRMLAALTEWRWGNHFEHFILEKWRCVDDSTGHRSFVLREKNYKLVFNDHSITFTVWLSHYACYIHPAVGFTVCSVHVCSKSVKDTQKKTQTSQNFKLNNDKTYCWILSPFWVFGDKLARL